MVIFSFSKLHEGIIKILSQIIYILITLEYSKVLLYYSISSLSKNVHVRFISRRQLSNIVYVTISVDRVETNHVHVLPIDTVKKAQCEFDLKQEVYSGI